MLSYMEFVSMMLTGMLYGGSVGVAAGGVVWLAEAALNRNWKASRTAFVWPFCGCVILGILVAVISLPIAK